VKFGQEEFLSFRIAHYDEHLLNARGNRSASNGRLRQAGALQSCLTRSQRRRRIGDIVMLTAAVRDLHAANPGQFETDVRTAADASWENNPHLRRLNEGTPGVEVLDMHDCCLSK
jgi:hypothetical protein